MVRTIKLFRILFLALVAGLGAFGISRLDFNVDILNLLPQDMPGLHGTRIVRDQRVDTLILSVESSDEHVVEASAKSLEDFLAKRPDLCHHVRARNALESDPEVLAEAAAFAWWNAPAEEIAELRKSLAPDSLKPRLDAAMEELSTSLDGETLALQAYDPLGLGRGAVKLLAPATRDRKRLSSDYGSRDGLMRLVYLRSPMGPTLDYRAVAAWIAKIRSEVDGAWRQAHPEFKDVSVKLTGEMAFRSEVATGMASDMQQSIGGVSVLVAVLFWLMHRSLKPLFWLMLAIFSANLLALGVAGILFGSLNVMSIGFAAILTGLIEDFGVVGLHEAMEHPGESYPQILRRVFPSVCWSASITAAIFATLALSRLPGIAQMGLLCALGVLIGAAVMLLGFLPLGMKSGIRLPARKIHQVSEHMRKWTGPVTGVVLAVCVGALVLRGMPQVIFGPDVLRPDKSEAYETFDRVIKKMSPPKDQGQWVPIFFESATPDGLRQAMSATRAALVRPDASQDLLGGYVPLGLVPDASAQQRNAPELAALAAEEPRLLKALDDAGFTEDAGALAKNIFSRWKQWAAAQKPSEPRWPHLSVVEGPAGSLLGTSVQGLHTAAGYALVKPGLAAVETPALQAIEKIPGAYPSGWPYLHGSLQPLLRGELKRVALPAAIVVLVILPLVFRSRREIIFVIGTVLFSAMVLTGLMSLFRLSWNMVSVGSIALILGLGMDFTIHMIYALRRHPGDPDGVAGMGRALAYCGLSTGLAFGSLAVGTNKGLISLGLCTMIGVLTVLFTAAFVLPWAWHFFPVRGGKPAENPATNPPEEDGAPAGS